MATGDSTTMSEKKDNIQTCSICFEKYDNEHHQPKLLPCSGHHTLCLDCAVKLTQNQDITCPSCQQKVCLPAGGAASLQTNFYMQQIQELLKQLEGGKDPNLSNLHVMEEVADAEFQFRRNYQENIIKTFSSEPKLMTAKETLMSRPDTDRQDLLEKTNIVFDDFIKDINHQRKLQLQRINATYDQLINDIYGLDYKMLHPFFKTNGGFDKQHGFYPQKR